MSEAQSLRRTSDALLVSLSELEELEQKKRSLPMGSKAQLRVSEQVETLARKVLREAGTQTELVELISAVLWMTRPLRRRPREMRT